MRHSAERAWRRQQDHRLAALVGLGKRVLSALAGADAVQVEEDVVQVPTFADEPAEMGDEDARHGNTDKEYPCPPD